MHAPLQHLRVSLPMSVCPLLLAGVVLLVSTKGITTESAVCLNGDMPKYLMNGAYLYDLLRDLPVSNPLTHISHYFARYPALSLGHHSLILPLAEIPFYAVFGISVFSARLAVVAFMLLAALALFFLVKAEYDETVAFLSTLLMITTPIVVRNARIVMSEIPTLALVIVTVYLFHRYLATNRRLHLFATVVVLLLSLCSKPLAVFLVPVLLFQLLIQEGPHRLVRRELRLAGMTLAILALPIAVVTLTCSRVDVSWLVRRRLGLALETSNLTFLINMLWKEHVTWPTLALSVAAAATAIARKDRRAILFLLWIAGCYLLLTAIAVQKSPRYGIYWIPAFCALAAASVRTLRSPILRGCTAAALLLTGACQLGAALRAEVEYADGYEEAAQYVLAHRKGESVLYCGHEDTGYFIFFVRKHDPGRNLIVLRSDKLLTEFMLGPGIGRVGQAGGGLRSVLEQYGVGYVVVEDAGHESLAVTWLRSELQSQAFVLRKAVDLSSNARALQGDASLLIYEDLEYRPAPEGSVLEIKIRQIKGAIRVPFKDLVAPAGR